MIDKYRGCLIGGAAGDALGYTIEFLSEDLIFSKYGERGITEYSLVDGVAQISDDTQMTLFTASGLINARAAHLKNGGECDWTEHIYLCYMDWLRTQVGVEVNENDEVHSWLVDAAELWSTRAPGSTCINALAYGDKGSVENPPNDRKGCGGIMRVAPVGLYAKMPAEDVAMLGAQAAAITHGHELGYIPAAAFAHIVNMVAHNSEITLYDAVQSAKAMIIKLFPDAKHLDVMVDLLDKAIVLSGEDIDDLSAIKQLGEGWVAEETLAIAVYASLKYADSFDKAIIAAVNHNGDSDSTGAVAGNIMGAYLGLSAIPQKYIDNLEVKGIIMKMADDLYNG